MNKDPVRLFLAPMEGVTDWIMRETLTQMGGIDGCVTEFLRVTKNLHPKQVFLRHCPELLTSSCTASGTPVYFQLLGSDPIALAENAKRAADLGAIGIDLNFGCPAKTVNRHDGGAVLLKDPGRLFNITKTVRQYVSSPISVSAKMRLGYEDPNLCIENGIALQEAGASWITLHCRTKTEGYRPPAHWKWVPRLQEKLQIPVIANGDITGMDSFLTCARESGVHQFMIGRAGLSNPFLFRQIKENLKKELIVPRGSWHEVQKSLGVFYGLSRSRRNQFFATARTKQWLRHLAITYPEGRVIFDRLKVIMNPVEFQRELENCIDCHLI